MILLTRVYSRIALKIFRIEPYEIKKKVFPVIAHENYWYRVFIRSKVWFFSNLSICVECLQKERKCYWIYFIRSHVMILDNYHIKEKKGEIFFVWTKGSRETAFFFLKPKPKRQEQFFSSQVRVIWYIRDKSKSFNVKSWFE